MKLRTLIALFSILMLDLAARTTWAGDDFDPVRYGAKADGQTLDTVAIQKAIDACAAKGGGTVRFGADVYLSGTIDLKNHVTLYLESGAILRGSADPKDYPDRIVKTRSYTDTYVKQALIAGEGLEDVAIRGRGTIDGQGSKFKGEDYLIRPYLIRLVSCRDVLIEDINLRNSAMWMEHYLDCERLTIRGVRVFNHEAHNNDGLDLDACRDVTIESCIIDADDDALVLKSTMGRPCENVTIANCVLASHCNALKMGTESSTGFKNISISNCTIQSPRNSKAINGIDHGMAGIALEMVDGGQLENIAISNVTIDGVSTPIFMRLGNRARPYQENLPKPPVGTFRNVLMSNIVATRASKIGCLISGIPGHRIENVTLRDIHLEFEGGGTREDASRSIAEKETSYPESLSFGILPAYGFYLRHVKGLVLENVQLTTRHPDQRPPIVMDDAAEVRIDGKKVK